MRTVNWSALAQRRYSPECYLHAPKYEDFLESDPGFRLSGFTTLLAPGDFGPRIAIIGGLFFSSGPTTVVLDGHGRQAKSLLNVLFSNDVPGICGHF